MKAVIIKKVFSTLLAMAMLSSPFVLVGCRQAPSTDTTDTNSTPSTDGIYDQINEIEVSQIVDDVVGKKDFETVFNNALFEVASKKYESEDIKNIDVVSFTANKNGKLVLTITLERDGAEETEQLTYEGDTTKLEDFFDLGTNKSNAIDKILSNYDVSTSDKIVLDSQKHEEIEKQLEDKLNAFDEQTQLFKGISAEELIEKEDEKPIEYITAQEIVDEAFADIDFDADLMETVQTLFATRAPTNKLNKIYAVDYDIAEDGYFTFYVESEFNKSIFIRGYTVNSNTNKLLNYLNLNSKSKEKIINEILNQYSLNEHSEIEKGSDIEATIREVLNNIIVNYKNEKKLLESTEKANIKSSAIFNPKQFTQQEMEELGIENMNAFAEALLNNTRGEGFDQIEGWTMEDVVATYVGEFSGEAINYKSRVNILIITKQGMYDYELWTQRHYGSTENRYGMILSDNPNTGMKSIEEKAQFGDNVILYSDTQNFELSQQKQNES
ncbi:MAG: hypothetical protein J6A95_00690 [Clostridia bacterium]|nr:hypothetical protein [Clostridia bacterium]